MPKSYYDTIPGGKIIDVPMLNDSDLPENKNALRNNLAQQIKHKELVNLQYNK